MENYLRLRRQGWYGDNNYHIQVALEDGRVVAACVSDYLARPNCGVIEFVLVEEARRGRGVGKTIHDATLGLLQNDARRVGRPDLDAVAIELNDPFRVAPAEDNHDPFERAMVWDGWGYGRLCFPYVQPALSESQQAVNCLLFAVKPIAPALRETLPGALVLDILEAYLRWAMRIERPEANADFAAMKRFLQKQTGVQLEPLAAYIGRDPAKPLLVVPVSDRNSAQYLEVIEVYRRAFPPGPTAIDDGLFAQALAWPGKQPGLHYHLWGLAEGPGQPIRGMASFFVMPRCGFAGYLALEPPLKGTGRAYVAVKRMEEQMIRDESGARDWYAECETGSAAEAIARRAGFAPVPVRYHQPALDPSRFEGAGAGPQLTLLRKRLGSADAAPPLAPEEFLDHLRMLLAEVYRMDDPKASETYRIARASLLAPDGAA